MSKENQTTVEWLQEWLQPHFTEEQKKQFRHIWKHAKQLEKEHLEDSYDAGYNDAEMSGVRQFDGYYNAVYK